jgi:tetratricopeptide (TPR) repeat protein
LAVLGIFVLAGVALAEPLEDDEVQRLRDLLGEGAYAEAQTEARERLGALEAASRGDSAGAGDVLDVLVESLWRSGKAGEPETRALAERALELKVSGRGPDDPSVAESLNNLAILHFFGGEYLEARPLWERAIIIRRGALGPDHPQVAHMMNNLANLLTMIGEYDRARELYEGALAIREEAFGPEHAAVGDTLGNLSLLLTNVGDYAAALRASERAVEIKKKALGPEHPKYPSSLSSLGTLLWRMGDFERALPILEEAVDLYRKSLGPDHPFVGQALNNLAELLRASGDLEGARRRYEESLGVLENAYGPDHPEVGLTLDNLGDLLEAIGDDTAAEQTYRRALAIREAALGPDHPDTAESLLSLGLLEAKSGEIAEGEEMLRRAVTIREVSLGPAHPQVSEALTGLATVVAANGGVEESLEMALRAESISRDHLRLTGRSLNEQLAIRYAGVRNRGLDLALTLAGTDLDPAALRRVLDALVRSRAVVLDEMAARQRSVAATEDSRIAGLAAELANARSRLANLSVRGLDGMSPEAYRVLLDEAGQARDRAENALAAASASFAAERQRSLLGLDEVASSLHDRSGLVAYVLYDHTRLGRGDGDSDATPAAPVKVDRSRSVPSYLAMVLAPGSRNPAAIPLGSAEEIDRLVARWKRELVLAAGAPSRERAAERYREVAGALSTRIWDPVARTLNGATRVLVVPDGTINLVSFATLPVGEDRFVVQDGPLVHYLSAERDAVPPSVAVASGRGLLALGGPAYDLDITGLVEPGTGGLAPASPTRSAGCASFDSLIFDPLPGAAVEAGEVVEIWKDRARSADAPVEPVVHLTGPEATEAALKSAAPGSRVLHLATHGFFLGGDCASGLERSRGLTVVDTERADPGVRLSPLLLSGLALAGASRGASEGSAEEDGILTAEEIASLDLSGVQWAVLSACDTGVGEIQAGEGVFGLRRAFQVAGVQTLVMSLWPVDDSSTRRWMGAFYRTRLIEGRDVAEAMRAASLEVLGEPGEPSHPYYWGAFVAAGSPGL